MAWGRWSFEAGASATAQEAYRAMVKSQVAPALRTLGFKGSGRSYDLGCEDHWAMLGLQGSQWSNRRELRFTVNLLVVSREVWDRERSERPQLGAKPSPNTHPGSFAWWQRLGLLMPERTDKWWRVRADEETSTVAHEALEAIRVYGLPAIEQEVRASA